MAKKIGEVQKPAVKPEATAKIVKVASPGPVNDKGLYTTGNLPEFDPRKHIPMGKKNFDGTASFLEFRAMLIRRQAVRLTDVAGKLDDKIKFLRQYGDEEARKKAMKMQNLRDQLAKLEAEEAASKQALSPAQS